MPSNAFYRAQTQKAAARFRVATGAQYQALRIVQDGLIVNRFLVGVRGQRYDMDSSRLDMQPGDTRPVYNAGRLSAARYVPADTLAPGTAGTARPQPAAVTGYVPGNENEQWVLAARKLRLDANGNLVIDAIIHAQGGTFEGQLTVGTGDTYILIDGVNALIESSNYSAGTAGWRINSDGTAEYNDVVVRGTVYATDGAFTGTVNANAGVFTGEVFVSEFLTVGTGVPVIYIDGDDKSIYSSNYAAGAAGFKINSDGYAEFENIFARGSIKTVVFEKALIQAFAGGMIVAKSASTVHLNGTVNATYVDLNVKPQAGGAPFAVNDIIRIKNDTIDFWGTVAAIADHTTYWGHTIVYQHGSTSGAFYAGDCVVDYGQAGQGYLQISADGTLTEGSQECALVMRSHAGAPWSAVTTHIYMATDGRLYAGGGDVVLDNDGITLSGAAEWPTGPGSAIKWQTGSAEHATISTAAVGTISSLYLASYSSDEDIDPVITLRTENADNSSIVELVLTAPFDEDADPPPAMAVNVQGTPALEIDHERNAFFAADVWVTGDVTIEGGATIEGSVTIDGDARIDGDIMRASGSVAAYAFVPLTTPLTSTAWDGDARSTTLSKALIDLSEVFGAPAGIKAVLMSYWVRDSSSSGSECWLLLSPNSTGAGGLTASPGGLDDDIWATGTLIVPCTPVDGDIYFQVYATGDGRFDAILEIWGYWI